MAVNPSCEMLSSDAKVMAMRLAVEVRMGGKLLPQKRPISPPVLESTKLAKNKELKNKKLKNRVNLSSEVSTVA